MGRQRDGWDLQSNDGTPVMNGMIKCKQHGPAGPTTAGTGGLCGEWYVADPRGSMCAAVAPAAARKVGIADSFSHIVVPTRTVQPSTSTSNDGALTRTRDPTLPRRKRVQVRKCARGRQGGLSGVPSSSPSDS